MSSKKNKLKNHAFRQKNIVSLVLFFIVIFSITFAATNQKSIPQQATHITNVGSEEKYASSEMGSEMSEMKVEDEKQSSPDYKNHTDAFRKSIEDYDILPEYIVRHYYEKIGGAGLLDIVEERPYCHEEGHAIGKVVLEKTDDLNAAMKVCSYRCSSGCFHGVLMGLIENATDETKNDHATVTDLTSIIKNTCDRNEIKGVIQRGNCAHGVGHALMYLAENDTERALTYCRSFEEEGMIYYCATGVYMERDQVYKLSDATSSKFYPCDENSEFTIACYRYKIRRIFKNTPAQEIANECLRLDTVTKRRGCFHGLGFAYMEYIGKHPEALPAICKYGDTVEQRMCVEGAIGALKEYDKQKARTVCSKLSGTQQEICDHAIEIGNFGLNRTFSLYVN